MRFEDQAWLVSYEAALRTWSKFALMDRFRHHCWDKADVVNAARNVLIFYKGQYIETGEVIKSVQRSVIWNQMIYEAWNYEVARDIDRIARTLSPCDSRALLVAAELDDVDWDALADEAGEALEEARTALYGE